MDLHNPDTAEVSGTVSRSHQAQTEVGIRKILVVAGELVVGVAVGMSQGVAAEGRC